MDRHARQHRTTVLTVDTGPDHRTPARFYTLVVDRGSPAVHTEVLVPDGAELRPAHGHDEDLDEAA